MSPRRQIEDVIHRLGLTTFKVIEWPARHMSNGQPGWGVWPEDVGEAPSALGKKDAHGTVVTDPRLTWDALFESRTFDCNTIARNLTRAGLAAEVRRIGGMPFVLVNAPGWFPTEGDTCDYLGLTIERNSRIIVQEAS